MIQNLTLVKNFHNYNINNKMTFITNCIGIFSNKELNFFAYLKIKHFKMALILTI